MLIGHPNELKSWRFERLLWPRANAQNVSFLNQINYTNSSFPEGAQYSITENWRNVENHKIDELYEFLNYDSSHD